jgi:hypothetical protein
VEVIYAKLAEPRLETGRPKFGWLKRLKNSPRNSTRRCSRMVFTLKRLKSTFCVPGAVRFLHAEELHPKLPCRLTRIRKRTSVYQCGRAFPSRSESRDYCRVYDFRLRKGARSVSDWLRLSEASVVATLQEDGGGNVAHSQQPPGSAPKRRRPGCEGCSLVRCCWPSCRV